MILRRASKRPLSSVSLSGFGGVLKSPRRIFHKEPRGELLRLRNSFEPFEW